MSKTSTEKPDNGASTMIDSLTNEFAAPWLQATRTSFQVTSAWSDEALRFANRRLNHNRETVERLAKCDTWQDILDLQMSWAKEIVQDYLDESRELMSIMSRSSNGHGEPHQAGPRSTASHKHAA